MTRSYLLVMLCALLVGCGKPALHEPKAGNVYMGTRNISVKPKPDEVVYFLEFISPTKIRYGFVRQRESRILADYYYDFKVSGNRITVITPEHMKGSLHQDWEFEILPGDRIQVLNAKKQKDGLLRLQSVSLKPNLARLRDEANQTKTEHD